MCVRSRRVAVLWHPTSLAVVWTRSCCASLAGLRNRFWQCPQKCTIAPGVARVEPAALDGTSEALLEAVASGISGPPSNVNCRGGGCMDTATAAFSAATAALTALRFARGSLGPCNDRLRVCCLGGDSPSASIVASIAYGGALTLCQAGPSIGPSLTHVCPRPLFTGLCANTRKPLAPLAQHMMIC